jgi:hypothetical protein
MGAERKLRLTNAITDVKTIFFIQCSWEMPKWKSIQKRSLTECKTALSGGRAPGRREYHATSVSNAVFDGL